MRTIGDLLALLCVAVVILIPLVLMHISGNQQPFVHRLVKPDLLGILSMLRHL